MAANARTRTQTMDARTRTALSEVTSILMALLEEDQPARVPARKGSPARTQKAAPKPAAKKAPAKKAVPAKVTKGAQTRETLSRKDWNRTLTAKARLAGGGTYKRVMANWAQVREMADAGATPDEVLATFA